MGWSGGSIILQELIPLIEEYTENIENNHKRDLYMSIIDIFRDADCDTYPEAMGISESYDAAVKKIFKEENGYSWEQEFGEE